MKLTASIVAFHTSDEELETALRSLFANGVERVYVIDNSSSIATRSLCENFPAVSYTASANVGYGAGHNQALRMAMEAGAKYNIVMNSDVEFDAGTLQPLVDFMDSHPDVGALQPRIVDGDGRLQYTVKMLPTPLDLIGRRFLPEALIRKRNHRYELRHIDHDQAFDAPYHQGSFMMLRMDALAKTGLFDERFFMYPEDIDLTRRIHQHYRTMYVPLATVIHRHRRSSYHSLKMLWIHCINMVRYFNKWGWWNDSERKKINRKLLHGFQ
ncbi:MAG: glycosyltransferase family 2 protein [Firmicutes bacterium]|nr:glycosyltransferase family 2 protein [Bacillota bacterium]MCM1401207.1 glycosyltransferase family 2 protein [Bacteroides sp.]MCM1477096.1 glycosyltransferase family 2 protein [Bacteroides sp.]